MAKAIVELGGKQYWVEEGTIVDVEKVDVAEGKTLTIDSVLLVGEGPDAKVGTPTVPGAKVTAKVVRHFRDDKVIVFKFKRKTGYKKTAGHRQQLTTLSIEKITTTAKKAAATA